MKALQFQSYGPPTVLALKDLPTPTPQTSQALIQIKAAAINPSDLKNVAGHFNATLPRIPGRDYAGIVVAGDAPVGLEVWGSGANFGITQDGSHAQYVLAPTDGLSQKPKNISMEQAAAVGVPYLAAWMALIQAGNLQPGETLLIVGVSGAVGQAATQIARWKKARVIGASTHSDNLANADAIINTKTQDLPTETRNLTNGKGADLILDAVGGLMFEPALKSLAKAGRQIAIATDKSRKVTFDLVDFYHNQSHLIGVDTAKLTPAQIAEIMDGLRALFEQGNLQPTAITTWPLDRAIEAYQALETPALPGPPTKHILIP